MVLSLGGEIFSMKITLCNSLSCVVRANEIRLRLESMGHEVYASPYIDRSPEDVRKYLASEGYLSEKKPMHIKEHFDKISKSDAIVVVNMEKDGIEGYIGGNVFAEMMFAFYMRKKIFLLNPMPTDSRLSVYLNEIRAISPVVVNGDLSMIR